MRGQDVKDAQSRLQGTNVFKQNFQPGKVDGIFGEGTARACKRAKYWCGYEQAKCLASYGNQLNGFLSGKVKLPPAYASRRKKRLTAAKAKPLRQKALDRAKTQIGTKESPRGSNRQKYGAWYGLNGAPWCAMFVTWCYVSEGSRALARGRRFAYVPWVVGEARAGRNHLAITRNPQPGDLVCFDWNHDGTSDHVGLYEKDLPGGDFQAIEGNTGEGNDSNGGEVMRRRRNVSQVQAFVHVGG
jgi:hypothetical protein